MSKIIIIGAGAMGSAFALPCLDNNHDINIVGTHLENDFIDKLYKNNNLHPGLNTKIPKEIKIHKFEKFDDLLVKNSIKILLSSFILFAGIYLLNGLFFTNISGNSVLLNSTLLLLMIFLAIIIYFGLVIVLKVLSVNQLREYLKR